MIRIKANFIGFYTNCAYAITNYNEVGNDPLKH